MIFVEVIILDGTLLYIAQAISLLVAVCFFILLIMDMIRAVWFQRKKIPYEWKVQDYVINRNNWKNSLLMVCLIIFGTYTAFSLCCGLDKREVGIAAEEEYLPDGNFVECHRCYSLYDTDLFDELDSINDGRNFCPQCTVRVLEELTYDNVWKCVNCLEFFEYPLSYGGYGLCENCADNKLVSCQNCDERTIAWCTSDGYTLCERCIGVVYDSTDIRKNFDDWWNG